MKLALFLLFLIPFEIAFAQQQPSTAILDRLLSQGYDWRIQPGASARPRSPTHVHVNVYIRRISQIGDTKFEVDLTFRQNWNDPRLSFIREPNAPTYVNVHPQEQSAKRIWTPDTFFLNAYDVKVHSAPNPNELLRVRQNGDVLSSQRLSIKINCPMNLEVYPRDEQACVFDFASYAYTTDDIVYAWKEETPVQLRDGLRFSMEQFVLKNVTTSSCSSQTATGVYSCLRASMRMKRTASGVLSSKVYVIPLVLVILSWLPFIINAQLIIVRVVIGLICLSTFILHWSIIGKELPKTQYATGADVWLMRCLGFILATFVQLVLYVWIVRATTANKERKLAKQRAVKQNEHTEDDESLVPQAPPVKEDRSMGISLLVDLISLGIFFLSFFVFFVHYFTKY